MEGSECRGGDGADRTRGRNSWIKESVLRECDLTQTIKKTKDCGKESVSVKITRKPDGGDQMEEVGSEEGKSGKLQTIAHLKTVRAE